MVQSVERPTSAQVMISRFMGSSPASGSVLTAPSLESASDSVSPSLSAPPPLVLCLFLSLKTASASQSKTLFFFIFNFLNVYLFIFERERESEYEQGRGRERGKHRIRSRLQAPSCQHRAWCRARTHKLRDHDLRWSRMCNRLRPPRRPPRVRLWIARLYQGSSSKVVTELWREPHHSCHNTSQDMHMAGTQSWSCKWKPEASWAFHCREKCLHMLGKMTSAAVSWPLFLTLEYSFMVYWDSNG